jgi:hypothetical protein
VDKVIPMSKKVSPEAREEARFLASLVFESLPILTPRAELAERRKLAADMLSLCAGRKPERITPEALGELIRRSAVCVHDQEGRCPLVLFTQVMAWELNVYFGVGDETDKGFRRYGDSAKPLGSEHEEE